jgi:hypothetical protein
MTSEHHQAVQHLWYGDARVPAPGELEVAWKAVKAIAAGDRVLSEPERLCLVGRMSALGTPPEVMAGVLAWNEQSMKAADLFAQVPVPSEARRPTGAWIVYNGLSVAIADRELAPGELEAMVGIARRLDVDAPTVQALYQVVHEEADVRRRRIAALNGALDDAFRY